MLQQGPVSVEILGSCYSMLYLDFTVTGYAVVNCLEASAALLEKKKVSLETQ